MKSRNKYYSELTEVPDEVKDMRQINFDSGLEYLDNFNLLYLNLSQLESENIDFKIIKGFISKDIKDDNEFNKFDCCLIQTEKEIKKDYKFLLKTNNKNIYKVTT